MSQSNRPTIRVNCPQCLAGLEVDPVQAGQRVPCPQCRFSLVVPAAAVAGGNLFEDLFSSPPAESSPQPGQLPVPASRPARADVPSPLPASDPLQNHFEFDPEMLTGNPQESRPAPEPKPVPAPPGPPQKTAAVPTRAADPKPAASQPGSSGSLPGGRPDLPALRLEEFAPPQIDDAAVSGFPGRRSAGKHPAAANPPASGLPDDGFGLEDDLKLAPLDGELARPAGNPLAVDPLQPLRVEGIESDRDGLDGTLSVKCRVCDSGIQARVEMIGQSIVCPDCGSMVRVERPVAAKPMLPEWARPVENWRELAEKEDAERFRLAGRILPDPAPSGAGSDSGLSSGKKDRMQPRPPPPPVLNEDGEDVLAGARPSRRVDPDAVLNSPFVGGKIASEAQTRRRMRQAAPPNEKNQAHRDAGSDSPEPGGEQAASPSSGRKGTRMKTSDPHREPDDRTAGRAQRAAGVPEDDDTVPPGGVPTGENWTPSGRFLISLDNLGSCDRIFRSWLGELVRDRELWIRSAACVACFGMAWWMGGIIVAAMQSETLGEGEKVLRIVFPGVLGGVSLLAGLIAILMTGSFVFQSSGDRRPRLAEWPGFAPTEWVGPAFFWAVGIWLGALPGILMGALLWWAKLGVLSLPLMAFSAMLLAPLLLLSAWYNGSPFQVVSGEVLARFRGGQTDWLKYLPASMIALVVFSTGHAITCISGMIACFLGAGLEVAAVLLFATVSGLYCGLMGRKIERGD